MSSTFKYREERRKGDASRLRKTKVKKMKVSKGERNPL